MLIFGLDYIKNQFCSERFCFGECADAVSCLDFSEELLARTNLKKAIFCADLAQVLKANAALCEYIIVRSDLLAKSVALAQNYLFDSKILALVRDDAGLLAAAAAGVDAVLFCEYNEKYKEYFLG